MKPRTKKALGILSIAIIAVLILILICNGLVKKSAKGRLYNDVSEIPYRKTAVVLGTNVVTGNGSPNLYYEFRIKAAADLYHAHKVSYIIVSGDNHKHGYNEPECMRQSLIALGVPDSVIFCDYAGFRTFDSMVRAKEVFGQDSVTVISQQWHNERAVYIAQCKDFDAIALNASDVDMKWYYVKSHLRESLAKVKVVMDILFHKKPKFLGDPVYVG